MAIKHSFVSAKADGTDSSLVKPSDWNASHTITTDSLDDGSGNKMVQNGTNWEFWSGGVRIAILDSSGNLHMKGVIITEDGSV